MNYHLNNHVDGYHLSSRDILFSIATGLSGAPYAARHLNLSKTCQPTYVWGHKVIAILESIPIVGGLAALIERITVYIYTTFFNSSSFPDQTTIKDPSKGIVKPVKLEEEERPAKIASWRKKAFSINESMVKMRKNAQKAIIEHKKKIEQLTLEGIEAEIRAEEWIKRMHQSTNLRTEAQISADIANQFATERPQLATEIISLDDGVPTLEALRSRQASNCSPLKLIHHVCELQGPRDGMEDAHIFKEFDQGYITGVFDGHGGSVVSNEASKKFEERFPDMLKAMKGNVHAAFEVLIDEIHSEIDPSKRCGSTAVICFIDKRTHLIYTATLGDSEANIYRKMPNGETKSVPLSCVRDWGSRKDVERAKNIYKDYPGLLNGFLNQPKAKLRRVCNINVARSFGDKVLEVDDNPVIIHKPKLTISSFNPKTDLLILRCDGVTDVLTEKEMVKHIEHPDSKQILASQIAHYALNNKKSRDNITVITIQTDK